jgi:hypothetical protein
VMHHSHLVRLGVSNPKFDVVNERRCGRRSGLEGHAAKIVTRSRFVKRTRRA